MTATIRPKDRDTLIQALRAGVVPRVGQHLMGAPKYFNKLTNNGI